MSRILAIARFCDDIRFEMGGKTSLMGIYTSDMIVPEFPAMLPRLAVVVDMAVPLDFDPPPVAVIRLELPGDQVIELESKTADIPRVEWPGSVRRTITAMLLASPVEIAAEGRLRASIQLGDEEVFAGSIYVHLPSTTPVVRQAGALAGPDR
jgi:hypothetical protein